MDVRSMLGVGFCINTVFLLEITQEEWYNQIYQTFGCWCNKAIGFMLATAARLSYFLSTSDFTKSMPL